MRVKPTLKINLARQALRELFEEAEYTREVLRATAAEMETAVRRIEEERIWEVLSPLNEPVSISGIRKLGGQQTY